MSKLIKEIQGSDSSELWPYFEDGECSIQYMRMKPGDPTKFQVQVDDRFDTEFEFGFLPVENTETEHYFEMNTQDCVRMWVFDSIQEAVEFKKNFKY